MTTVHDTVQPAAPLPQPLPPAEVLISQAIDKGASIDTLERLMALRKEVLAEKAKEAFNTAMAAFQAECPTIKKTKLVKTKDGKDAYRYAPIESVVEQVKHLLEKHGFRYSTTMAFDKEHNQVKSICRVVHTLGHEEVSEMDVPLGTKTLIMSDTQVVAAASTFAKRYAFLNAFGILTGDEDTDARKQEEPPKPATRPAKPVRASTPEQQGEIQSLAHDLGMDLQRDILDKMKWAWPLTFDQATATIEKLKMKLNKILDDAAKAA